MPASSTPSQLSKETDVYDESVTEDFLDYLDDTGMTGAIVDAILKIYSDEVPIDDALEVFRLALGGEPVVVGDTGIIIEEIEQVNKRIEVLEKETDKLRKKALAILQEDSDIPTDPEITNGITRADAIFKAFL